MTINRSILDRLRRTLHVYELGSVPAAVDRQVTSLLRARFQRFGSIPDRSTHLVTLGGPGRASHLKIGSLAILSSPRYGAVHIEYIVSGVRGHGRRLVQRLQEACRPSRTAITAEVHPGNAASLRMFNGAGFLFARAKNRNGMYLGRWCGCLHC